MLNLGIWHTNPCFMKKTTPKALVFILFLLCPYLANTQVPYPEWERSFGGSCDDGAYDVQKTPDGGFIVVGYASSSDGNLTENKGLEDFWVLKLDQYGFIQWQKTYGGKGKDIATSVQVLPNNKGYLVLGLTDSKRGDGDITQALGKIDMWLLVLDMDGEILKRRNYGGNQDDIPGKIIPLGNEEFLLLGTSHSTDIGLEKTPAIVMYKINANNLDQSSLIFKSPPFINVVEHRYIPEETYAVGGIARQTSDKGLIICAYAKANSLDFFVLKLNSSYQVSWQKKYGNKNDDELATDVIETKNGEYWVIGEKRSQDWVLRLNSKGDSLDSKYYGASNFIREIPFNIIKSQSGKLIMCGTGGAEDVLSQIPPKAEGRGLWVAALDEDRLKDSLNWSVSIGLPPGGTAFRIIEVAPNEYVTVGKMKSAGDTTSFCSTKIPNPNNVWIAKLSLDCKDFLSKRVKARLVADRDTSVCENTPLKMMATNALEGKLKYYWIRPHNRIDTSSTPTLYIPKTTQQDTGLYQLMIEQNGCFSLLSDPLKIKLQPSPESAAVIADFNQCTPSVTISANPPTSIGTKGRWTASDAQQVVAPNDAQTMVNNLLPGENRFVWSLSNSVCGEAFSSDTLVVNYLNRTQVKATADLVNIPIESSNTNIDVLSNDQFTNRDQLNLSITTPPGVGQVSIRNQQLFYQGIPFSKEPVTFTYNLCDAICPSNCNSTQVTIVKQGETKPPNRIGFTPNGDGKNDLLVFEFLNPLYKYPILVFNRWGKVVYENQNYLNEWDGKMDGKLLPVDTYYYILKNLDTNEKYEGSILLKY
jgi:gliding motility-associated-like protein